MGPNHLTGPRAANDAARTIDGGGTMDVVIKSVRNALLAVIDRLRRWVVRPDDVSPIFRELVRNGTFEKPKIPNNYHLERFDPAASSGWTEESPDWGSHCRDDGDGAFGSNQYALLKQNAIFQALNTKGLQGQTLDVSLYFGGAITVSIGSTTHVLRPDDFVYVPGAGFHASFTHVVQPGETPTLNLRLQGDSPKEFLPDSNIEVVRDRVDNISVLAWRRETGTSGAYLLRPVEGPPKIVRRLP
jgi:hypothetical protein